MRPLRTNDTERADAPPEVMGIQFSGRPRRTEDRGLECRLDLNRVSSLFLHWWSRRGGVGSPWPAFDQFLRELLLDMLGAKRVRLFHVVEGGQVLRLLTDEVGTPNTLFAPTSLMSHVVSVGRRYIRGDPSHGPLVDELATESEEGSNLGGRTEPSGSVDRRALTQARGPAVWMFPIRDYEAAGTENLDAPSHRSIGLVVVGDLDEAAPADPDQLDGFADVITEFWLHVRDYECLQIVRRTDRGSGVLNRLDFVRMAEIAVAEARREGEPVAVLAVALEGLRRFDDEGWWLLRDRVIEETGRVLRRKLRANDLVGRFSDDRFVILMRWLDLSLGKLIAARIVSWVKEGVAEAVRMVRNESRTDVDSGHPASLSEAAQAACSLKVRCGLACDYRVDTAPVDESLSWSEPPRDHHRPLLSLRELLMGALSASAEARRRGEDLCLADLRNSSGAGTAEALEAMP